MLRHTIALLCCGALLCASANAQTVPWPGNPGFPNVAQTAGSLLSGPLAPTQGRTAILAYHNGVVFSIPELPSSQPGSDFQVRIWNITDPVNPRQIDRMGGPLLGVSPMPVNAHGYIYTGGYLVMGADWPPETPWSFRATAGIPGLVREASNSLGAGERGDVFQPWHATGFWSYSGVSGNAELRYGGNQWNSGSQLLASWDHLSLTGVIGHPFILGNLLIYASDQSRSGIATYDISNPSNPVLLDVLKNGGPGGYWPELWGGDGKLYVVFPYNADGNGFRVADISDPTDLRLLGDVPLSGDSSMYAQFQDEYAFMGSHKVDMRTLRSVLQLVPPTGTTLDVSQFALPLGNLLLTGGIGEGQGMGIWAHQSAPDLRPPSVGYHIPRAGQINYPQGAAISLLIHETLDALSIVNGSTFRVRPLIGGVPGAALGGRLTYAFDDVLTFAPSAPLAANTTYEVRADGIRDAAGNAMTPFAYTFSTGVAVGGNRPPAVTTLVATPYPASPGQSVAFSTAGSDPDGDTLQYRFDFGDGSAKTPWSSSTLTNYAYAQPGHYRATAQARDAAGVIASKTAVVSVLTAAAGPAATASTPILCHAASRRVWTANPDSDTISALNADSLIKEREVAVCDQPRSVARSAGGEIWVACAGDDRLVVVNENSGVIVATLNTGYGSAPFGIAMSPDGATAYVSLSGKGALRRYASATRTQTGELALGPNPRALAVAGNGARVLVTRFLAAAHHSEVWDVNAASFTLTRAIRIPKQGDTPNRDTTASGRGVVNHLSGAAFAPLTGRAFISGNKPNNERGPLIAPGFDLDTDNTLRNVVVEIDPAGATDALRFRRGIDLDNSDSAAALAFSPLGDYLLIALQGDNEIMLLDALVTEQSAGLGSLVARIDVGAAPQGVCVDATSNRTFVHNFLGRSISVLESDALFRSGAVNLARSDVAVVSTETLAAQVLNGKRIFYRANDPRMSPEGYMSCASCHLDGGHDGRVWDFSGRGEGLRNTVPLQGRAGLGHGNVHWSANFDEIQDFENDIRNAFGGRGFMSDADYAATAAPLGPPKAGRSADLDALAAYVGSLDLSSLPKSPHRNADGSATAAALQGETIFLRENCASCHAGARLTDSTPGAATLHDVGTLRSTSGQRLGAPLTGIDTPSLLGVFASAPYLHDGSAATLDDVFRNSGGTRIAAESGTVSGGAQVIAQWVELTNDDSVRGRAFVQLDSVGHRLAFNNVDGASGGIGALELRVSTPWPTSLTVIVNGSSRSVALPTALNEPNWRTTNWLNVRVDNVPLNAGASNSIELVATGWFVAVDEVQIASAANLTRAQAHRRVVGLSVAEQDALKAFLLQLDRGLDRIFGNGFEP